MSLLLSLNCYKLCGYVVDFHEEMLKVLKLLHGHDAAMGDSSWMAVDI